jgi:hypothetical protein
MPGPRITVETHDDFALPAPVVWKGITDAVMTLPKPLCFNLGVPLPRKCELTSIVDGVGRSRRCTSDHGAIEQEITVFLPGRELSFRLVSHTLRTVFAIDEMDDRFIFTKREGGVIRLTRTTTVAIPPGRGYRIRCWAVRRSVQNVHHYVYRNIARSPGPPSALSASPSPPA